MTTPSKKLSLNFHGRIIEHLGMQMYQSPTAAIAEIISNCWDADAENISVDFDFNSTNKSHWKITISDDGIGMSFDECQNRYLKVGYSRRASAGPKEKTKSGRPVMGRKGIGKFAGFGIARFIKITTVAKETQELTEFELDLEKLHEGDTYVSKDALDIELTDYEATQKRIAHGTKIELRDLKIGKKISESIFSLSLARRFSINKLADKFSINLNGTTVDLDVDNNGIEMSFPKDLPVADQKERSIVIDAQGWGIEKIDAERTVRWKINFYEQLIKDDEISGITIFAHKKLAQVPFFFNLTGGTASQAGPEYMAGRVEADWIDELGEDVISTERQRLNWQSPELEVFENWGEKLLRRVLSVWKTKRGEEKLKLLNDKISQFSTRLDALKSEGAVVKSALTKLAQLEKLSATQFVEMGSAMLLAWEGGRLRELIRDIGSLAEMDEPKLLALLTEANAITALHTAETVRSKLDAITGLEERIKNKELENAVRDYIAKHPWLISPEWETFAKEPGVATVVGSAQRQALNDEAFKGRIDLILSSGKQLLILEFMRPGLTLDYDHVDRFNRYMNIIEEDVKSNSGLRFEIVSGYIVADKLDMKSGMSTALKTMKDNNRFAYDWATLLDKAKGQWKEFLDHIKERAPDDPRVKDFLSGS